MNRRKVKQHGFSKRSTWRKVHIAVDGSSLQIHTIETTKANVDDAEGAVRLIRRFGKRISSCVGTAHTIKIRGPLKPPLATEGVLEVPLNVSAEYKLDTKN